MSQRLPIMEAFYTVQGEGAYAGQAAYFIRVGGCDVGCIWCDVKASWNATDHPLTDIDTLVKQAAAYPAKMVVITGGEPLMYDMAPLTTALNKAGFRTHLETSGAYPLSGAWHWICFSPKKFMKPLPGIQTQANELKVVVAHPSDLAWANEHANTVGKDCVRLLQPEWSKAERMMPLIVNHVKTHPAWRISLQTHKYLNIP